jgi:hypothetical protein
MLVDQAQAFPLARGEQFDRVFGDDRTQGHDALVKRAVGISSTLPSVAV